MPICAPIHNDLLSNCFCMYFRHVGDAAMPIFAIAWNETLDSRRSRVPDFSRLLISHL